MRPLMPRERKLIALAIVLALGAVAWSVVAAPVIQGFVDRSAERDVLRTEYVRNARLSAGYETWRGQLADQKSSDMQFAVAGANQQVASAALAARIEQMVLLSGGIPKAVQPVAGTSENEIRVRASLELTMEQLYRTLKQLEVGVPYVVVEYLSIRADRALQTDHLGPMDVRLDVSAQYRPQGPAPQ